MKVNALSAFTKAAGKSACYLTACGVLSKMFVSAVTFAQKQDVPNEMLIPLIILGGLCFSQEGALFLEETFDEVNSKYNKPKLSLLGIAAGSVFGIQVGVGFYDKHIALPDDFNKQESMSAIKRVVSSKDWPKDATTLYVPKTDKVEPAQALN